MIIKEKVKQAINILKELGIDVWLIFCRETSISAEPALDLITGHDVVGQSAFFITKEGDTIALVSEYDASNFIRSGIYQEVLSYTEDISKQFTDILEKISPDSIAVNYSKSSVSADGLSYGMYLLLRDYLKDTAYLNKLVSAEEIQFRVRGRKNRYEIELLSQAAEIADKAWHNALDDITVGLTEIQIADLIKSAIHKLAAEPSFEPTVCAGSKTRPGHGNPTNAVLEKGDLLHVDFGARHYGYCSDIQRIAYFKKDDEKDPPEKLLTAFNLIKSIVDNTSRLYTTGAIGHEIDQVARQTLLDNGYEEYNHCLGHQVGREVHDGASLVGPKWKRYGQAPFIPLEKNNVFTVELGIDVPSIGHVGFEDVLVVTDNGGRFMGPRQTELMIL